MGRNDDYSSDIEIDFRPNNNCDCDEIVFIQYYREITNLRGVWTPEWVKDKGDPYPYPSQPPNHWIKGDPKNRGYAKFVDQPGSSNGFRAWQNGNYIQVFSTTAYCAKGKDAGKSYGSITWGHSWNYNKGTVSRFIEGQVVTGNPAKNLNKFGGARIEYPPTPPVQ